MWLSRIAVSGEVATTDGRHKTVDEDENSYSRMLAALNRSFWSSTSGTYTTATWLPLSRGPAPKPSPLAFLPTAPGTQARAMGLILPEDV